MLEKPMKLTEEETQELVNEKEISCSELLQEIEPLLKEYFISFIDRTEEKITMSFRNGQRFDIIVSRIA